LLKYKLIILILGIIFMAKAKQEESIEKQVLNQRINENLAKVMIDE